MIKKTSSLKKICSVVAITAMLCSCEMLDNQMRYDRSGEKTQQDYRDALSPRPLPKFEADEFIPDMQSYISNENEEQVDYPLVSISVNQTVSLRDLLFEMADQVGIDLELDPQIRGTLIFTVRERPFDEVIKRIAEMAGLRYSLKGNLLRVELDRPYIVSYNLEYLNFTRTVSSDIELDVSVISGEEAEVGSGTKIETEMESDFWDELDENIEQILTSTEGHITLATLEDPKANPRSQLTEEETSEIENIGDIPPPILNITAPPSASEPQEPNAPSAFSINKQTGTIAVFTTSRQHKVIDAYLTQVKKSVSTQILVEAKILEVSLTDEFSNGINWDFTRFLGLSGVASLNTSFPSPSPVPGGSFSLALGPGNATKAIIDSLTHFGTVRALSSPRVTVLNNQSALLNVVKNKVFFEFKAAVTTATTTTAGRVDLTTKIRSVPLGVMLNVMPTVDFKTGEITMMLRPTVSSLASEIVDPSLAIVLSSADPATINALGLDTLQNRIPELAVQEIDSVVKIQSGEVIIMGGLMTEKNVVDDTGVPVLSSVPYFGKLFGGHRDTIEKTELVIFIKATIVPSSDVVHDADRKLYKNFALDRRPFKM